MANTLANLKACVPEFDTEAMLDEGVNIERRWTQWLENFECCLTFEGVEDADNTPSKKRAALLAIGGQKLRELFGTLTPADTSYAAATTVLKTHFTSKKNVTAERYKFFCMKPLDGSETHDHWITRLRSKVKDCEFDQMNDDEAIKLVITLHTHSEKLQSSIIQKDMNLSKVIATAKSLELAQREVKFMKENNTLHHTAEEALIDALRKNQHFKDKRPDADQPLKPPRRSRPTTYEICRYCGEKTPHVGKCKARNANCNFCHKRGHFERVCESKAKQGGANNKDIDNISSSSHLVNEQGSTLIVLDKVKSEGEQSKQEQYPSTEVQIKLNGQPLIVKVDSGAEANIISEATYRRFSTPPTLKSSTAQLKPYGSPPLPLLGQFDGTFQANDRTTKTTIYVTKGKDTHSLMSKYSAFDLGILHITVNNVTLPLNVHTISHQERTQNTTQHLTVNEVTHMEYSEMAQHLTPLTTTEAFMTTIKEQGQEQQIKNITEHYPAVFKGIGKHKYRQVKLLIDPAVKPIIQPQRKIAFAKREKLDKILDELEQSGVIEHVDGPTAWLSNLVLTPKANPEEIRMNVDMTTANTAIRRTRHVIPTLEELRYQLNGAQHFTKLDMKHGYMQMELNPESRSITTFYTHRGLRRSRRLAMGINSATEVFHEEIHQTLSDIPNVCNIYDDIIVYGATAAQHNLALAQALQRLQDCGLTLNKEKCVFDKPRIQFFGVIFSKDGLSPAPEKVTALQQATPPTNAAEVRSFLGMANFSSYFIPEYSVITTPLRALTRKHAQFRWTPECQTAFNQVCTALSKEPVMAYYEPSRKTKLIVDGSKKTGLSSILTQLDPETNQYKTVRYDSRPTTPQEQRYSQIEIESAAVEFATTKNHIYLYGLPEFIIATDHKPLLPLYNTYKKDLPARILKHKIKLQGYNFHLIYEPGASNAADYLSRHVTAGEKKGTSIHQEQETELFVNTIITYNLPEALTKEEIAAATMKDSTMQKLMSAITRGYINKNEQQQLAPYKNILGELSIHENIVLRGSAIVVPEKLRRKAISLAHEGHQGLVRTKQYIRSRLWFPGLDKQISEAVEACLPCQASVNTKQQEPLKMTPLPEEPWSHL